MAAETTHIYAIIIASNQDTQSLDELLLSLRAGAAKDAIYREMLCIHAALSANETVAVRRNNTTVFWGVYDVNMGGEVKQRRREETIRREDPVTAEHQVLMGQLANEAVQAVQSRQETAELTAQRSELREREAEHFSTEVTIEGIAASEQVTESPTKTKAEKKQEKAEGEARYAALKGRYGKLVGGLMSQGDLDMAQALLQSDWGQKQWLEKKSGGVKQGELFAQASSGIFSSFEKLDNVLCCYLATKYMQDHPIPPDTAPKEVARQRVTRNEDGSSNLSGVMNPLFRLGISLASHGGPPESEYFKKLDTACGTVIMTETLSKQLGAAEVDRLAEGRGVSVDTIREEASRSQASQIFMAKNLMLAHLADFKRLDDVKVGKKKVTLESPWDIDVSAAFTHCSRVSYLLPAIDERNKKERQEAFWRSMDGTQVHYNKQDGASATAGTGLFRRGGSTHDLRRRKVSGKEFKEQKRIPIFPNLTGQRGMNVAVGGYGNTGIGAELKNDGSCGHIYTMRRDSTDKEYGAFLVGFESDAHKKTNQLGHTHGFGNGERASSFGGQRVDEIGNKYGGRIADLSNVDFGTMQESTMILERFMLAAFARNLDIRSEMSRLCGPRMTGGEFALFIAQITRKTNNMQAGGGGV